ncbi:sugar phosphate isomerase/epimerase [Aggregatimonas sangjinii]|uniref:Sugar phosphate isomerase/epimerase n=1 Tax=Aggregatimonas sangjinii TaxID=2583587 RepID=A0A5B7SMM3_9FLAO|nr:TIM barrel protein [Aggregatimonas sangjinii]QCW99904.1 sugar phosphate isomerase/epimerase [Aggregatimonas sangjinii]
MKASENSISRRDFTKLTATAAGALPFLTFGSTTYTSTVKWNEKPRVHLFSKHLQFLDYNEMAAAAAEMGFDGLDLTVRPKGHVLPERVADDLPKAVDAMKKYGIAPKMMTTAIWDAHDSRNKTVLESAGGLGFSHYRTDWLTYPEGRTIEESQTTFGKQARELEMLNETCGLIGCYQNHAGNHVGAPIWDLPPILNATKNEHVGCQYDIRHAVVEGGTSWELGLRLIKPFIKSIVIKDFKWGKVDGKWKPINTPLGEGMVDFNRYFSLLRAYNIDVPVSLHLEYALGGAEHGNSVITVDKKEVFARMKKDLTFLQQTWQSAE